RPGGNYLSHRVTARALAWPICLFHLSLEQCRRQGLMERQVRSDGATRMSKGSPNRLAFEQFELLAGALGIEHRLRRLDLLIQGERSVERLAEAAHLRINNASQHLQQLRRAGLVAGRKSGTQVIYSLADPEVITLIRSLWRVAERNLAELGKV